MIPENPSTDDAAVALADCTLELSQWWVGSWAKSGDAAAQRALLALRTENEVLYWARRRGVKDYSFICSDDKMCVTITAVIETEIYPLPENFPEQQTW